MRIQYMISKLKHQFFCPFPHFQCFVTNMFTSLNLTFWHIKSCQRMWVTIMSFYLPLLKKSGLSRVFKIRLNIFAIYLSLNISRQMRYFHTYTFKRVASLHVAAIDNEFSSTPASKTSQPSHDGVDDRDQTRAELFAAFVIPLQTWHLGKASLGYTWWEKEIYWYPLMKIVEVIHGSEATCMLGSMMYMW